MKNIAGRKAVTLCLGLLALLACAAVKAGAAAQFESGVPRRAPFDLAESPESIILKWPKHSRTTAALMLEKYGRPDQFDQGTLVWFNKGMWKRTIVRAKAAPRVPAARAQDCLQQTIGYLVPNDKLEALRKFNPLIEASPTAAELTFSSDSEARNLLAINLADEIITGKKTAADAREFFAKTTRLSASGKSSPYTEGLLFEADNTLYMAPTGGDF